MRLVWVAMVALAAVLGGCVNSAPPEARQWIVDAHEALRRHEDSAAAAGAGKFIEQYGQTEEAGEAHYIRGLALVRLGRTEPGKADLAQALERTRRKDVAALAELALGNLAYTAGDLAEAQRRFRRVLAALPPAAPDVEEPTYLLACIHQRQGDWEQADLLFSQLMYLFAESKLATLAADRIHARQWSIQAAAYETPAPAAQAVARLKAAGLAARVESALRAGKLKRLVLVGSYPAHEAAHGDLAKVKAEFADAFLVPVR